jgi:hypothetical protein
MRSRSASSIMPETELRMILYPVTIMIPAKMKATTLSIHQSLRKYNNTSPRMMPRLYKYLFAGVYHLPPGPWSYFSCLSVRRNNPRCN